MSIPVSSVGLKEPYGKCQMQQTHLCPQDKPLGKKQKPFQNNIKKGNYKQGRLMNFNFVLINN